MTEAAAQNRYTLVAITLHWLIALGIIGMIALGWTMGEVADKAEQYALIQLHKSFGITILLLSVARIVWRLMNPPPPEPPMPAWQTLSANAVHVAFYALIIIMPLSGWMMVSASTTGIPTNLFQTIPWPHLPFLSSMSHDAKEAFHGPIEFVHSKLAWVAIALLVLHVGAALKHQILDKDNLLARMIPGVFGRTAGPVKPGKGALYAFGAAIALFILVTGSSLLAANAPQPASEPADLTQSTAPAAAEAAEITAQPTQSAESINPATAEQAAVSSAQETPAPEQTTQPAAAGPVPAWTLDPAASKLAFRAAYMGRPFSGQFNNWTASISFDPERPEATRIRAEITMGSVNTGETFYDENVVLGDWFDVRNHPKAIFVANSAKRTGANSFEAAGTLTLKNITHPVALPFTLEMDGDIATVHAETTLQRLTLGVGADTLTAPKGDEDWVANDVGITIDLKARKN